MQYFDILFSAIIRYFRITEMHNASISESEGHLRYHVQEDGRKKQPMASKRFWTLIYFMYK